MSHHAEEARQLLGRYGGVLRRYPRIEEYLQKLADGDEITAQTESEIDSLLDNARALLNDPGTYAGNLKAMSRICSQTLKSNVVPLRRRPKLRPL